MNETDVLEALRDAAVEVLMVDGALVTLDARFHEDLEADSLDLVELVMALEERFDVSIPEKELEGIATVKGAVELFARHIPTGV
ncbi:MAG TPA: acyl carrier protein [Acidimicrobiia bacterium]|nr:acyl carrier protein [Acidimicrobiia bacterium]